MNWQEAFLVQARSDNAIRQLLNQERAAYSHQLHYLQMLTEKLAKGMSAEDGAEPPKPDHAAFVRFLTMLKQDRVRRRRLGYARKDMRFNAMIDSLLPLAERIQHLAPNYAGFTKPNPEYPWNPSGVESGVIAPCEFAFPDFSPRDPRMGKLMRLIEDLLLMDA